MQNEWNPQRGDTLYLDGGISITVKKAGGGRVTLGIAAPQGIPLKLVRSRQLIDKSKEKEDEAE